MVKRRQVNFWHRMPFVRLILPLLTGIVTQYYLTLPLTVLLFFLPVVAIVLLVIYYLPLAYRYRLRWLQGAAINLCLACAGGLLVYANNIRNRPDWMGDRPGDILLATINEPPVEKPKTFKAEIKMIAAWRGNSWQGVEGKALAYFQKDSSIHLSYGNTLLINKPLAAVQNAGNPGGFDYRRYSAFQNIYHQVYLQPKDYRLTHVFSSNRFQSWLFTVRAWVITTIQRYIKGKTEAGVAEALLIGYRNDLDKDLVQAYSNTGVVHIIAISGLHLGLIYASLLFILRPFKKVPYFKVLKPLLLLVVLWLFTLLAGAAPSILRSAVMFSFIVAGEALARKSSIYNTLAASAFVMLCINPFYLWDVGFLLSYSAVVSIIMFSKPIYNWFYFSNKLLNGVWRLVSVTLSAQVLTAPIIFFFFHQFANFFLLSNCLIVPLSSVILFCELLLIVLSWLPALAGLLGHVCNWLLHVMNAFIEQVNKLPHAVYDGIQNTLTETILLYIIIITLSSWLINKIKNSFLIAAISAFAFVCVNALVRYQHNRQQKIIVYNVPQHSAIDFISGSDLAFVGDSAILQNAYLHNFHLKPSRTFFQSAAVGNLSNFYFSYPFVQFRGVRMLWYDKPFHFSSPVKVHVDFVIMSHNPSVKLAELIQAIQFKTIVFDGSNSPWRIEQWKKECDSLHLNYYDTASGAFVVDI